MTINEKKQLTNYIKVLVRESLGEMDSMPRWWNNQYGVEDDDELKDGYYDDVVIDDRKPGDEAELDADPEWEQKPDWPYPGSTIKDDPIEDDEDDEPAGLDELRQLVESFARDSVAQLLYEKKGGWKKNGKGNKKGKSEKKSSSEKTLMAHLNNDSVNAAHYYYKLFGAKTDAEKAAARSLGYKKAKGEKTPNKKRHYRFTPKERNKLYAMLTADNN